MRTVLLASLRRYTRRYVAAAVAVLIGVAFVVLINPLTSGARSALLQDLSTPYENTDVVVSEVDPKQAERLLEQGEKDGQHVSVSGWVVQSLADDTQVLDRESDVGTVADDPAIRWQTLSDGHFPRGPDQALVDADRAKRLGLSTGDRVTLGGQPMTVVGLVDNDSTTAGATVYLPFETLMQWQDRLLIDTVGFAGPGSTADQIDRLHGQVKPGQSVKSVDQFLDQRAKELNRGVDVIAMMLLLFAAIAMAVSVLVIANTFSVLFAQRTRDLALLRCVGATRAQVRRGIRLEALLLGAVSATVGVVVGAAGGLGLVALVRSISPEAMGSASLSVPWMLCALVAGIAVSVLAGWLPTRRATQVTPLAALRPDDQVSAGSTAGRVRIGLGLALFVLGVAGLAIAVSTGVLPVMLGGGFVTFVGILVLGPVIVPWMIRRLGWISGRLFGVPGRLAASNAVRNPKRTAATTASLLIGVTLTTAMLTGLSSTKSATDADMDLSHPVDYALDAGDRAMPTDLVDSVRDTPDVDRAQAIEGVRATLGNDIGSINLLAPDGADGIPRGEAEFATPEPGTIVLPDERAGRVDTGDRVEVRTEQGRTTLTVADIGRGWGGSALVAPQTLQELGPTEPLSVWVRADAGADSEALGDDLNTLASNTRIVLTNELADRDYVYQQLDITTITVVALLGIAVVIALIGIGSTLGLSVLERGRENAMLRALGLTRRELRRTLALEAVLLSVSATLIGTIVGVAFAWVGVQVMISALVQDAHVVIPFGQLAVALVISGLAGLLACLLPARKAAKVTPAAGLALE